MEDQLISLLEVCDPIVNILSFMYNFVVTLDWESAHPISECKPKGF